MPINDHKPPPALETAEGRWYADIIVARHTGFRPLEFDLRVPRGPGPWPLVFWIHGGAWCEGHRRDPAPGAPEEDLHGRLINRGFAVGLVDYRLSQEAVYPAQLHDIQAAIKWARRHAGELSLDVERFAVMGDSAGGHLAALTGLATIPADGSTAVHAVIDWYGPTELTFPDGPPDPDDPAIPLFGGDPVEVPDVARSGSPLHQVHRDAPPFLCVHGALDRNVPVFHSEALVCRLRAYGVRADLLVVPEAGHGLSRAPDMAAIIDHSIGFLAEVLNYDPRPSSNGGC